MTLHIKTVYTEEKSPFATSINSWLIERGMNVESFNESDDQVESIDGVVIFHENHNFDRRISELRDMFEKLQVSMHKIDINGTMNVALSHLSLFFERTQCKNVLFIGSESLKDHPKLTVFKEKWNL